MVVHGCLPTFFGVHRLDSSRLATFRPDNGVRIPLPKKKKDHARFGVVDSIVTKRRARGSNPQPHYWGTTFPVGLEGGPPLSSVVRSRTRLSSCGNGQNPLMSKHVRQCPLPWLQIGYKNTVASVYRGH